MSKNKVQYKTQIVQFSSQIEGRIFSIPPSTWKKSIDSQYVDTDHQYDGRSKSPVAADQTVPMLDSTSKPDNIVDYYVSET